MRFIGEAKAMGRWFDVSAYRPGGPESRQVAIVFTDITEHKTAEEAIRQRDARIELFLNNATDYAVIICDREDRIIEWLGGAERITGWQAAEVHRKKVDVIFTPEDRAAGLPAAETAKAAETGRAEDTALAHTQGRFPLFRRGSGRPASQPEGRTSGIRQSVPRRDGTEVSPGSVNAGTRCCWRVCVTRWW